MMVKGCHYFLHHKKRLHYKEDWIDIKWYKNPYRCSKKYRSKADRKLNHHLAHFEYPFTKLSRQEIQNFPKAFKNFFSKMDLSSWLNLLGDWKNCVLNDESLFEWMVDYAPLETYEQLLKLHEACIVAYHWAEIDYPPPNRHLIKDYLSSDYVDGYRSASPYERIEQIFYEKNHTDLRDSILSLYPLNPSENKPPNIEIDDLRYTLRWLLETGWLLLQTNYFPEDWLDPDAADFLRCPVPKRELSFWKPESLSNKEQKNLKKTLSKLYYGIDVRKNISVLDGRIIFQYERGWSAGMGEEGLETRNRLLKTLDILTLVLLDLCKRRTKPEGICYPPEKTEKVEEKE
ncbi:hypothetical protein BWD42_20005 [Sphingobacterium sp. CZ-UAM]|nr:hypothetical protein BWD42_20005 [Sphingobacterium sp. CZ-UAM]